MSTTIDTPVLTAIPHVIGGERVAADGRTLSLIHI